MEFDDLFLRRTFMIIAMKRSQKHDFRISKDIKVIEHIIDTIENDKNNHYLATSRDDRENMVSFAISSKFKYDDEKRVKTTLDKYIRRQLNINYSDISDYNLERFCKSVMMLSNGNTKNIIVYNGKNLKEYFRSIKIDVKNISNKEILFYTANEKKVAWVVASNFARALLWTCDDGTKLLDVIYPKNKICYKSIIDWANKNNIKHVYNMTTFELNKLRISMKCRFFNEIPPQDTFKYAEFDKNLGEQIIISADPNFGNLNICAKYKPYYKELPCNLCKTLSSSNCILSKIEDDWCCSDCIKKNFKFCNCCNKYKSSFEVGYQEEGYSKYKNDRRFSIFSNWICDYCIGNSAFFKKCYVCNTYHHEMCMAKTNIDCKSKLVCKSCVKESIDKCSKCFKTDVVVHKYGKILCTVCANNFVKCHFCNAYDTKYSMSDVIFKGERIKEAICLTCKEKKERCQICWTYLIDTPYFEVIDSHYSYRVKQIFCKECKQQREEKQSLYNKYSGSKYFDKDNTKTKVILREPNIPNIIKPGIHSCKEGNAAYPVYVRDKYGYYGMN